MVYQLIKLNKEVKSVYDYLMLFVQFYLIKDKKEQ
jgi:hypothetical protein